ncbi:TonB-dependent receptor domain-containing protein [Gloeobacter violaceus]|uniref:Glr0327 protein n=1 Tax=Gloeobacter violaceus (strain ATCC 29082 / PCC 7421) TaxID=251221 RepID=Q7NNT3_GLOVI|nr:TonB-dependent receptor [Gloeobacter violaceus]BAC88268.1 glr0327 [Gloeobacter violaceus PCC 7421]
MQRLCLVNRYAVGWAGAALLWLARAAGAEPTPVARLDELAHPLTRADALLAQSAIDFPPAAADAAVQITGVQLTPTDGGIEILLETNGKRPLRGQKAGEGNRLSVDVPNAQLRLPDGRIERRADPAPGVTAVTVAPFGAVGVRIIVETEGPLPLSELRQTERGLLLSLLGGLEEEVVVTAQKTPQKPQDVPISLTVLPRQLIEDADITSLRGIAQNTPNFTIFDPGGTRSFFFYSIRGLSNFNFASQDGAAFYIDDVPYDYGSFITQELTDLERVEVLRGPQNTLYGRSSQAGVVNIVTRKPANRYAFTGLAGYGSNNNLDLRASVNVPAVADQLFLRLSGNYGRRDGFFTNTFLGTNLGGVAGGTGRGQLLWTPSPNWEVSFHANVDDYRDRGYAGLIRINPDPFRLEQNFDGFNQLNANTQALRVFYRDENLRVSSITARRFSRQESATDADFSILDGATFTNVFSSTVWSQEIRLQSPESAKDFQWLFGAYYESREFQTAKDGFNFNSQAPLVFGEAGIAGASLLRSADTGAQTYAVFGQASYKPGAAWTLTAGLRYETNRSLLRAAEQVFAIPGFPATALTAFSNVEKNGDALLPRFTAEYRFAANAMIYGSIARGYKPPGVNIRPETADNTAFEAEFSWNYEIGLKSAWFDDRLGVNLALFHNPVSNYQVNPLDAFGIPRGVTNADVAITGGELEVRAKLSQGLDLVAGFGLADAWFADYTDRATGQSFNGKRLPFAPALTYNVAVQYRGWGGVFARAELVGRGSTYFDEGNRFRQDPYALVNARLGYEFGDYGIYLYGNNLFDTRYVTLAADGPSGSILGTVGSPATFGAQFKFKL